MVWRLKNNFAVLETIYMCTELDVFQRLGRSHIQVDLPNVAALVEELHCSLGVWMNRIPAGRGESRQHVFGVGPLGTEAI